MIGLSAQHWISRDIIDKLFRKWLTFILYLRSRLFYECTNEFMQRGLIQFFSVATYVLGCGNVQVYDITIGGIQWKPDECHCIVTDAGFALFGNTWWEIDYFRMIGFALHSRSILLGERHINTWSDARFPKRKATLTAKESFSSSRRSSGASKNVRSFPNEAYFAMNALTLSRERSIWSAATQTKAVMTGFQVAVTKKK